MGGNREKMKRVNLSQFPHSLSISSPFPRSLSISSSFSHSLSIFFTGRLAGWHNLCSSGSWNDLYVIPLEVQQQFSCSLF